MKKAIIVFSLDIGLNHYEVLIPLVTEHNLYHYHVILQGYWEGKYGRDQEPILNYLSKYLDDLSELAKEMCEAKLGTIEDE